MPERNEIKIVADLIRLRNTKSGNPSWRVVFSDGTVATTHDDADVNYGIANSEHQAPRPQEVTFDEHGRIIYLRPLDQK